VTDVDSTHPLGPDAPREDHLGLAFGGLAFGVALGIGVNALVGFAVRTMQANRPPATGLTLDDPIALTLFLGTLGACLVAAVATWRVMAPVRNPYRQGMFAMVSGFASFIASLLGMAADRLAGRIGMVILAGLAFGAAHWVGRRLNRSAA